MATTSPIPDKCRVLVIGGGPGGSYAAAVLARENIDTVVLEAEKMPRYHIGESFLASFRHYLKFIDLHEEFDNYGFTVKHGAAFKLSPHQKEGFTDFRTPAEENRSWNVVRSEADELMFRHAEKSGARVFDGTKVTSIKFEETNGVSNGDSAHVPGRPVSAQWQRGPSESGTIKFDYVVDASGRAGLLSTKYLKNRSYTTALKNIACWAYFSGCGTYGKGTDREGVPFFEALTDETGWAWFIPLHNGTHSVGFVRNEDKFKQIKAASQGKTAQDHYLDAIALAPRLTELLGPDSKQVSVIRSGSDFSYHASSYAFPNARIVGDAGCFIDPFFSSGVHLAVTGALSAGVTIAASIRGDVTEEKAAHWHSTKIREAYARFLMVVLSAYQQMTNQRDPLLSELGEDNFDRAFSFFKPVIQGHADRAKKFTQEDLEKTVGFLSVAMRSVFHSTETMNPEKQTNEGELRAQRAAAMKDKVKREDLIVIKTLLTQYFDDANGMGGVTADVIDGRVPNMQTGSLTLVEA